MGGLSKMERLQKVMAHAGVASRRKSEEIITQGRVEVNGEVVTELGTKVDPAEDEVKVDGEVIGEEKAVYIAMNKPEGVVTTVSDPQGRKTVLDLIPDIKQRVYPVGRLDYDSSGLLLLTNDGELTNILTHPSYEIQKTYQVRVEGKPSDQELENLEKGVMLEDGKTAPAKINNYQKFKKSSLIEISIHEGRNRQIRRMIDKIGYHVISLKRIRLGPLYLDKLTTGDYRYLKEKEKKKLLDLKKYYS